MAGLIIHRDAARMQRDSTIPKNQGRRPGRLRYNEVRKAFDLLISIKEENV